MTIKLTIATETWPIATPFIISRASKTEAVTVVVTLDDGAHQGRGECVPYQRYNETPALTCAAIEAMLHQIRDGLTREALRHMMPAGAARNAIDCALWDLEAKRAGRSVYDLIGYLSPKPVIASYTLSLDSPDAMYKQAQSVAERPLLKLKLGAEGDAERLSAVRRAAPQARLIVDANEGWTVANVQENIATCAAHGVELIEQPLPATNDAMLADFRHSVMICADESAFDRASLPKLKGKYDAVNIKLDKAGGLTEALDMASAARTEGLTIMVGCMVSTSLSIAPAFVVAQGAVFADLDGFLLLSRDRAGGMVYKDGMILPPDTCFWG